MARITSGRLIGLAVAGALAVSGTGAAFAQNAAQSAAQKAVTARQEGYKGLGAAFKTVNDELRAGSPDVAAIRAAAGRMNSFAARAPSLFPKGSGVESGAKTDALPVIWSDAAGFAAAQRALQTETAKLQTAAASGDLDAVRAQARVVGGTCKACHDKYRAQKK